jgi:hypothetical protein
MWRGRRRRWGMRWEGNDGLRDVVLDCSRVMVVRHIAQHLLAFLPGLVGEK